MIPLAALVLAPFVARDAGLAWAFDGEVRKGVGHYDLVGKGLRGDVTWFVAPKGRYDAEKLYESDVTRTKDALESKRFVQSRRDATLAGMPAILSDQRYAWDGAAVAARCVYCASGDRAWVVRLWWPAASDGTKGADAFLKSVRRAG